MPVAEAKDGRGVCGLQGGASRQASLAPAQDISVQDEGGGLEGAVSIAPRVPAPRRSSLLSRCACVCVCVSMRTDFSLSTQSKKAFEWCGKAVLGVLLKWLSRLDGKQHAVNAFSLPLADLLPACFRAAPARNCLYKRLSL